MLRISEVEKIIRIERKEESGIEWVLRSKGTSSVVISSLRWSAAGHPWSTSFLRKSRARLMKVTGYASVTVV